MTMIVSFAKAETLPGGVTRYEANRRLAYLLDRTKRLASSWVVIEQTGATSYHAELAEAVAHLNGYLRAPVIAPMPVTVRGEAVTLTPETILATRTWYADNSRQCVEDARSGRTQVTDLEGYVAWREDAAAASMAGRGDRTMAFIQRAVALQTGECVALLAGVR